MTDEAVAESEPAPETNAPPAQIAADPRDCAEDALRREWGESYDARIADARRLAQDVATPELVAAVDRAGLGDDPHFLRAVADLAARIYGGDAAPAAADGDVRARLDALHALQHHKDPARRAEYRGRAVQDELARLYTAIHGDGPVVGRARRG